MKEKRGNGRWEEYLKPYQRKKRNKEEKEEETKSEMGEKDEGKKRKW